MGAALLGHQRSGKRARARKLARLNGVKVLMMRRTEEQIEEEEEGKGNLDFCDCNRSCKVLPEPVVGGAEETQPTMVQRAGVHEEVVNIIISLIIIVVISIVIIVNLLVENILLQTDCHVCCAGDEQIQHPEHSLPKDNNLQYVSVCSTTGM